MKREGNQPPVFVLSEATGLRNAGLNISAALNMSAAHAAPVQSTISTTVMRLPSPVRASVIYSGAMGAASVWPSSAPQATIGAPVARANCHDAIR